MRDPDRPARLLLTERDALLPLLRGTPPEAFDRPTVLPGWSVRDVLAHCAAALSAAGSGTLHAFTPEQNEADVATRRPWPIEDVVDELAGAYAPAATAIAAANGALDALALGEWVHGGDVREPLHFPDAYASDGVDDALVLTVERSREPQRQFPLTRATVDGRPLTLGTVESRPAELVTDSATFMRLCAGRGAEPGRYTLHGADPQDLVMFT